jgi:hypothetical protein
MPRPPSPVVSSSSALLPQLPAAVIWFASLAARLSHDVTTTMKRAGPAGPRAARYINLTTPKIRRRQGSSASVQPAASPSGRTSSPRPSYALASSLATYPSLPAHDHLLPRRQAVGRQPTAPGRPARSRPRHPPSGRGDHAAAGGQVAGRGRADRTRCRPAARRRRRGRAPAASRLVNRSCWS